MTNKVTKKENYASLTALIATARDAGIEGFDFTALDAFVNKEVESLDKKAEQARARAAKKKDEGDELRETIYSVLTDEPQTIPDILPQVQSATGDSTISAQKITARLKQLVDLNRVVKSEVAVPAGVEGGKTRKLTAYATM